MSLKLGYYMNKEPLLKHYIFLLGGHDLEMQEIKNILAEKKLTYHDHNLKWGARLSSYSSIFYKKTTQKEKTQSEAQVS